MAMKSPLRAGGVLAGLEMDSLTRWEGKATARGTPKSSKSKCKTQ
jgi:hypothetical protein